MTGTADTTRPPSGRYGGLLTQIMNDTLDADYEVVAARRQREPTPRRGRNRLAVVAVLAAFGVMVGVSALRTERSRPEAAAERAALISQIHGRQARLTALHDRLGKLQTDISDAQTSLGDSTAADSRAAVRIRALSTLAGDLAVTGPGVVIRADNAEGSSGAGTGGVILDTDLQALVNGLWQAGAEAISINGYRLTALTSIRYAGQAITVDYRSLSPPYVIAAIGDPDALPAQLLETPGGQLWTALRSNFGIRFHLARSQQVVIPADVTNRLRYAVPAGAR